MTDSWHDLFHWVQTSTVGGWAVWTMTVCLMIGGFLGTILPFLPGPFIIFAAAALHTWLRPESGMSWWGLGLLFLLLAASYGVDLLSGAVGSRWFGGSKWGFWGVLLGGVVGLFFGPLGVILGPLIGGMAFELFFARKRINPAVKATWGTVIGTTLGIVLKIGLSLAMVICFLVDSLLW